MVKVHPSYGRTDEVVHAGTTQLAYDVSTSVQVLKAPTATTPGTCKSKLIETVLVVVPSLAVTRIVVVPGILVAAVITTSALGLFAVAAIPGTTVVPSTKLIL